MKNEVLQIIDEVMNNREIDSIRNAILAIRDKVKELPDDGDDWMKDYTARLKLRGENPVQCVMPYFEGAKYFVIDTAAKCDTDLYGECWYE